MKFRTTKRSAGQIAAMEKRAAVRTAKIGYLEKFERRRGLEGDRRQIGICAVFSYFTGAGVEYRRAYWFPDGTPEQGIFNRVPQNIEVNE